MEETTPPSPLDRALHAGRWVLFALMAAALAPPLLKVTGVIEWSWPTALAPLTASGVVASGFVLLVFVVQGSRWVRNRLGGGDAGALTPPPERLEPPRGAEEAGERILAQHPELLAAVCHGFRFGKQVRSVLGRSVSDPWGVYAAAVAATPVEFGEVSLAAARHTRRFARSGKEKGGWRRTPSDSAALKQAVKAFGSCATRTEGGRGNPDCTFEHVTTIFGARTPARDTHLKSIAPRVRRLLEAQYPELATAELADGSRVKYAQWKAQAARDRKEIGKLKKELKRVNRKLDETDEALAESRSEVDMLRRSMDGERKRAWEEARAKQAEAMEDLRTAMADQAADHTREATRLEGELEKAEAANAELARERDQLERALFTLEEEEEDPQTPFDPAPLNGLRVLLVGGHPGQIPPLREHLESLGMQLLHEDRAGAAELVAGVHLVVLWIRFLSHPTAHAVKRECRICGVPCLYWSRTSPRSLAALLAEGARELAPEQAR